MENLVELLKEIANNPEIKSAKITWITKCGYHILKNPLPKIKIVKFTIQESNK